MAELTTPPLVRTSLDSIFLLPIALHNRVCQPLDLLTLRCTIYIQRKLSI